MKAWCWAAVLAMVGLIAGFEAAADEDARPLENGVVFESDFASEEHRAGWSEAEFATWQTDEDGADVLQIEVSPEEASAANTISHPIDLEPVRGRLLSFRAQVKAEDVSRPEAAHNGVKFMLHYQSDALGPMWIQQDGVYGDFDWREIHFTAKIPADAREGVIQLGLQDSHGTAWFKDVKIAVYAPHGQEVFKDEQSKELDVFKGHDLPRLRGVMSPQRFGEEGPDEDLRVLGEEWNANAIRWQLTTTWDAPYAYEVDYDLDKYDEWLDERIEVLDEGLDACAEYGIKVVIDLHSPPGGRKPNRDLVMFHERPYFEKFISVWERLAERYKDHPAVWAYDLVNEPVQESSTEGMPDFLEAQTKAARAIRAIDPDTPIIVASDQWNSPASFRTMRPIDVPKVLYQVHFYTPGQFTHQGVGDRPTGFEYPGVIGGRHWNKEALRQELTPVRRFQLEHNVHIFVGEFSAIRWAPGHSAYRYLRNCIELFEEYGWDWTYHAYREFHGWSVEHGTDREDTEPTESPGKRMELLLDWFSQNEEPRLP